VVLLESYVSTNSLYFVVLRTFNSVTLSGQPGRWMLHGFGICFPVWWFC